MWASFVWCVWISIYFFIAGESGEHNWTERLLSVLILDCETACWLINQFYPSLPLIYVYSHIITYTDRMTLLLLPVLFASERIFQVYFNAFTSHWCDWNSIVVLSYAMLGYASWFRLQELIIHMKEEERPRSRFISELTTSSYIWSLIETFLRCLLG